MYVHFNVEKMYYLKHINKYLTYKQKKYVYALVHPNNKTKHLDPVGKYLGHLNNYALSCKTTGISQITTVFNPDCA